jgi:plastocyanin
MRMFGRLRRVKYITHGVLLVGLLWLIVGAGATSTAAADVQITIQNFAFAPATMTIPIGTTVVWTNKDTAPHTATNDPGSAFTFDTGNITTGQSGKVTFNTAGTFAYHCSVHPNMHATIVVTGSASGTTANAPSGTTASTTSVLPKTGEARDNRNWGLIAVLIAAVAVIGGGTLLRTRSGARKIED